MLELPPTGAETYVTVPGYGRFDLSIRILQELQKVKVPFRLLLNVDANMPMCGISFARNMLISKALEDPKCKYVVALSNDIFDFTPGWLETFKYFMDSAFVPDDNKDFFSGAIGAINGVNFANYEKDKWTTWTATGHRLVSYDSPDWDMERVESVGGQCTIISADALRKVGLYDLKYGLGSYEGLDLGRRMIKAGYLVLSTSAVRVKHDIIDGNCKTLGEACKPWLERGPP